MKRNLEMSKKIAEKVCEAGGKAYYVGGFVRDKLLGIPTKDIDIEIHLLEPDKLNAILDSLGSRLSFGASFGINSMKGYSIDIALPRQERKTGLGHKDFSIIANPFLGTYEAARRRDFTVNALMEDILTGEIIDHFGGKADLQEGILRHIDDETFPEDSLRVLRGAQFAARFGFTIAPKTVELCRKIELDSLAKERVFDELLKALLQAPKPSVFFKELARMQCMTPWFDEIMLPDKSVDLAASKRLSAQYDAEFMLLALCKSSKPGMEEILIDKLTESKKIKAYVKSLYRDLELLENLDWTSDTLEFEINKILDESICQEDLILAEECFGAHGETLKAQWHKYKALMQKPYVMGRDLIDAGLEPGADFSELLKVSQEMRLKGFTKEETLEKILSLKM